MIVLGWVFMRVAGKEEVAEVAITSLLFLDLHFFCVVLVRRVANIYNTGLFSAATCPRLLGTPAIAFGCMRGYVNIKKKKKKKKLYPKYLQQNHIPTQ